MKSNLKLLIDKIIKRNHFTGSEISLSINYEKIIPRYKTVYLTKDTFKKLYDAINVSKITSFNLTIKIKRSAGWDDDGESDYKWDWKTTSFVFYGKYGSDKTDSDGDDDSRILEKNIGRFEFDDLGARGSFNLYNELSRPNPNGKHEYSKIYGNYFEFDKVGLLLDKFIALDILLDENHAKKYALIQSMKFEYGLE